MIAQGSSKGAAVFRFKEDQYATKEKKEILFPAGSKLPAQGGGPRLREILIRMTEHALFVVEDTLKEKGSSRIMPRRESANEAWNWHVTYVPPLPPSEPKGSAKE